jgi:nitrite reductase/ring-hydroxylating ferredoxin subunit/DMSO/TMAO reductase YedYZ heme-binding membrane subunit
VSARYLPVSWNRTKLVYDLVLLSGITLYVKIFLEVAPKYQDLTLPLSGTILRIQAFGTCTFLLLTLILCIGPLARLEPRFLPILYNRRHFGVVTCALGFVHASYVLAIYFSASETPRYVALLASNTSYAQILGFPFEMFGILALFLLLVLAVTSHDFWLGFLTPRVWKAIHMSVYVAYASIVLHVALGHLQATDNPLFGMVVAASVTLVAGLHVAAGRAEMRKDRSFARPAAEAPWVVAGRLDEIAESRALVVTLEGGERVAIFRWDGRLSALTNVCAHQNGPLGEGRVIDGCVTCPWHGFQYRAEDGCAPAPFTEKIDTYRLRLDGDRVLLDPTPVGPGAYVEPVTIPEAA